MTRKPMKVGHGRRLSGFDYLVLAGGAVNLVIVAYLIGYWLAH